MHRTGSVNHLTRPTGEVIGYFYGIDYGKEVDARDEKSKVPVTLIFDRVLYFDVGRQ